MPLTPSPQERGLGRDARFELTSDLDGVRRLTRRLHTLGEVVAPERLLPTVLQRVGLTDAYITLETPLGPLYIAYNPNGLSRVTRAETDADFEEAFAETFGRAVAPASETPTRLIAALEAWLRGDQSAADSTLQFDLRGLTDFEQAVLRKAREIPHGEMRPYAWVAREIGSPRAVRAVGTALAHNPIPLFIPCHRVVRSDGRLGAYSLGGPEAKRAMLEAEGVPLAESEALAEAGVRYYGNETTRVYCFPCCHDARRINPAHLRRFTSAEEARAAGYRPCKDCRPPEAALGA